MDVLTSYNFLETLNVLHIFAVFQSMTDHSSSSGILSYEHFLRSIEDGRGPV